MPFWKKKEKKQEKKPDLRLLKSTDIAKVTFTTKKNRWYAAPEVDALLEDVEHTLKVQEAVILKSPIARANSDQDDEGPSTDTLIGLPIAENDDPSLDIDIEHIISHDTDTDSTPEVDGDTVSHDDDETTYDASTDENKTTGEQTVESKTHQTSVPEPPRPPVFSTPVTEPELSTPYTPATTDLPSVPVAPLLPDSSTDTASGTNASEHTEKPVSLTVPKIAPMPPMQRRNPFGG